MNKIIYDIPYVVYGTPDTLDVLIEFCSAGVAIIVSCMV